MRLIGLFVAIFLPRLLLAGEAEKLPDVRLISEIRSIAAGKLFFLGSISSIRQVSDRGL